MDLTIEQILTSKLSIESLLIIHIICVSITQLIFLIVMYKKLLHWTSFGFWTWISFSLYFLLNPFFALLSSDLNYYSQNLAISGGYLRGFWILIVLLIGVNIFFCNILLHTKYFNILEN